MPDNKDIYGNVDRYSLFFDSRSGTYEWYPTSYKKHPIWSQYLTIQVAASTDTRLFPGVSTFPGAVTYTGAVSQTPIPDIARPMGMHGIGTQGKSAIKTNKPSAALYPSELTYPSNSTYPGKG